MTRDSWGRVREEGVVQLKGCERIEQGMVRER